MAKRSYPLEPLARVRKLRLEAAERAFSVAAAERRRAEEVRAAAERATVEHRRATSTAASVERGALERGELSAGDLAREGAWKQARDDEEKRLGEALARARANEERALGLKAQALATVASRASDTRVVDEHAARWHDGQRAKAERAEEDAAAEVWRPER